MKNIKTCPLCHEGKLSLRFLDTEIEHNGKRGTVKTQIWVCDVCGSELAGAEDVLINKNAVTLFKEKCDLI